MVQVRSTWLRRLVDIIQAQALSPEGGPPLPEVFRRLDVVGPPQTSLERRYFSFLISEFGAKTLPAATRPLIDDYIHTRNASDHSQQHSQTSAGLAESARVLLEREFVALRTVNDVCKRLGVCRSALERAFRYRFNVSVRTYLTRLRIERASKLLMKSELKIAAIANEIGFQDRAAFSVAYRRLTGLAPGEARTIFRDQSANKKN